VLAISAAFLRHRFQLDTDEVPVDAHSDLAQQAGRHALGVAKSVLSLDDSLAIAGDLPGWCDLRRAV
jgi:hypothetical protein